MDDASLRRGSVAVSVAPVRSAEGGEGGLLYTVNKTDEGMSALAVVRRLEPVSAPPRPLSAPAAPAQHGVRGVCRPRPPDSPIASCADGARPANAGACSPRTRTPSGRCKSQVTAARRPP